MRKGRIQINYAICDNAEECSGIAVCPVNALFWNKTSKKVAYDPENCIDCGLCAEEESGGCPVGAIRFANNDEDYDIIRKEIEEDKRTQEELFVERYGAAPVKDPTLLSEWVTSLHDGLSVVEFFTDNTINCMLYSIKIKEIQDLIDCNKFFKIKLEDIIELNSLVKINKPISELPCLLFYRGEELIGKIEGYYGESKRDVFFDKIKKIVNAK